MRFNRLVDSIKLLIKVILTFVSAFCLIFVFISSSFADEIYYLKETKPFPDIHAFAGELYYPEGDSVLKQNGVDFWCYNDGTGLLELNLGPLPSWKTIISPPVLSYDLNHIVYTEVYYYPNNQVTAKFFYLPVVKPHEHEDGSEITASEYLKSYQATLNQRYRDEILSVGTKSLDDYMFRTLTVVDWSYDSNRVLFKEHIGRTYGSMYATVPWVYDISDDKTYRLDIIRKAIIDYWFNTKELDLNQYVWDINILGWAVDSNNKIVVNAYLYPSHNVKKFLGCWSIDVNEVNTQLLSLDDEHWPVGKYGLVTQKY